MSTRREMMLGYMISFIPSFFRFESKSKEEICESIPISIIWTYRFHEKCTADIKVYKQEKCEYILIEWKNIQIGDVLLIKDGNYIRRTLATQTPDITKEDNPVGMVAENEFNRISVHHREMLGI